METVELQGAEAGVMAVPVQDILIYTAALVLPVVTGALVGHLDTSTFQVYRIQSLCMGVRMMGI